MWHASDRERAALMRFVELVFSGPQKAHKHKHFMGMLIRGFIWDIPILIVAYVLCWGLVLQGNMVNMRSEAVYYQ